MIYDFVKLLFKIALKLMLRLEVRGAENVPLSGPVVLASNHLSLWDPPVLGSASPRRSRFMAKSELFFPIFGTIISWLGAFPVKRGGADRGAIKYGIDILKNGGTLAVFPEGTRSKDGLLGNPEPGAMMMGIKANATIIPTYIYGTDMKRHSNWYPKVIVTFGKPLEFDRTMTTNKEDLIEMSAKWKQEVENLSRMVKV